MTSPSAVYDAPSSSREHLRELGQRLSRALGRQRGLTLKEVSARAGLSETYYGMIQRGQRRPSRHVFDRLMVVLDVPPDERAEMLELLRDDHRAGAERRLGGLLVAEPGHAEGTPRQDLGRGEPAASDYVVDASVLVKPFTRHDEADRAKAVALLRAHADRRCRIVLPEFARFEILNAIRFGRLAIAAHTAEALLALRDFGLHFSGIDHRTLERAVALSWTHDLSIYDAAYAALAESLEAPFVTADTKLANRLRDHRLVVRLADAEVP
jgi:predicted nucleic acid-binding protein